MIRNVLLRNFGVYDHWELGSLKNDISNLVDFFADNASGKSTLVDAITLSMGLTRPTDLFEKRTPVSLIRDGKHPAYIAALLANPMLPSGKRLFSDVGDEYTVLVRIDGIRTPAVEYRVLDGFIDIQTGVEGVKKAWINAATYNDRWERRGITREQRRQRIIKVGATDDVRKSTSQQLHQVFREYCSNPDDIEKQENCVLLIGKTKADIEKLQQEITKNRDEAAETRTSLKELRNLDSLATEKVKEERLLVVAQVVELQAKLDAIKREASGLEAKRIKARETLRDLQKEAASLQRKLAANAQQLKVEEAKEEDLETAKKKGDQVHYEAKRALDALVDKRKALKDFRHRKVPTTKQLQASEAELEAKKANLNGDIALKQHEARLLELELQGLKKHKLPLNVVQGRDALRDAKIPHDVAWEFLPKSKPQGYEEALGRNRFGILVDAKHVEKSLSLLEPLAYPGPVSTLTAKEYEAGLSAEATESGFTSALGRYVVVQDVPYLNSTLLGNVVKEREARGQRLGVDIRGLQDNLTEAKKQLTEIRILLPQAQRMEELAKEAPTWVAVDTELKATITSHEKLMLDFTSQQRHVSLLRAEKGNLENEERTIKTAMTVAQKDIDAQPGDASEVEIQLGQKSTECEDYYGAMRPHVISSGHHTQLVKNINKGLDGKTPPTQAELVKLEEDLRNLQSTVTELEGRVATQREELKKSDETLAALVASSLSQEDKEFRRVKKNVEAFGSRFNFPVELKRYQKSENGNIVWVLDYLVGSQGHNGMDWRSINDPRHSSGEGVRRSSVAAAARISFKSFSIVEDERRARPLRQPRDGPVEIDPLYSAVADEPWPRHRFFIERSRRAARARLPTLEVIETPVHRQAIEPGSDRGVTAKFRELSIGQQKDFLQ